MKMLAFVSIVPLLAAAQGQAQNQRAAWPAGLPVYDHVVVVIEENKDYEQIIGSENAPYINNVLKTEGACFTRMFGEEHHSEGNYFWLFSGSNQGVGFIDDNPADLHRQDYPFTTENLGSRLMEKNRMFRGYSDGLPYVGFEGAVSTDKMYARKHVPWISFANIPNTTLAAQSVNLRFDDFPADADGFASLPTVAMVVPNLINDMHDGCITEAVKRGDAWLKQRMDAYYQWAKDHNSLLIMTFDESDDKSNLMGLTNPGAPDKPGNADLRNRIPTIFAGARIKRGEYPEGAGINHVTLLRTLEAMYGLPKSGTQQRYAKDAGISDDQIITDVFAGK